MGNKTLYVSDEDEPVWEEAAGRHAAAQRAQETKGVEGRKAAAGKAWETRKAAGHGR